MEPKDLDKMLDKQATAAETAETLLAGLHTVMDIFRHGIKGFQEAPRNYDPAFDLHKLALLPKHAQEKYYTAKFESLLTAAVVSTQVLHNFHTVTHALIYSKTAPEPIQIEGVINPIDDASKKLLESCSCGHAFGMHMGGDDGPCMDLVCKCRHFTPKKKGGTK